ncbi:hypothetical protein ABZ716_23180 [Streptomyces sp. NPDC006687]|uniref:hypothetical protein n=1 Tax=unclassified Streptomyces TaxID=2593676 RepID=UPI0033E8E0F8
MTYIGKAGSLAKVKVGDLFANLGKVDGAFPKITDVVWKDLPKADMPGVHFPHPEDTVRLPDDAAGRPQFYDKTTHQLLDHQGLPKQDLTAVPKGPDHPLAEVPKHENVPVGVGAHTADVTSHTPGGTAGHTPGGVTDHTPTGITDHTPGGTANHTPTNSHTEPGSPTGTTPGHTTGGHGDAPTTGSGHGDGPSTGGHGDGPGTGGGHGDGPTIPHQGDVGSGGHGDAPDSAPGDATPGDTTPGDTGAQAVDPKVIEERIKELDDRQGGQGHAPGRHLYPDDKALTDRLGTVLRDSNGNPKMYGPNSSYPGLVKSENNVDPLTGTTTDGVTAGVHRVGAFATRFDDPADMVRADAYFRDEMARTGMEALETPIEDVLGPGAHERFTGYYRDPANLNEFKPVDFEGGTIQPVYRMHDGELRLHTMFANPARGRHP